MASLIKNKIEQFEKLIRDRADTIKVQLPSNISFEKFINIAKISAINNPTLQEADPMSLIVAFIKCATDGLMPDNREATINIYNKKQGTQWIKTAQYMPMVQGIIKRIRNSGELATISAHTIHENDYFEYCLGDNEQIIHKPSLNGRGAIIGAYAIATMKDGAIYRCVMGKQDIDKIKDKSQSAKYENSIWKEWYDEMAKKTVIRRLAKMLPMSNELTKMNDEIDREINIETIAKPINTIDALNNLVADADGVLIEENVEAEIKQKIDNQMNEYLKIKEGEHDE